MSSTKGVLLCDKREAKRQLESINSGMKSRGLCTEVEGPAEEGGLMTLTGRKSNFKQAKL